MADQVRSGSGSDFDARATRAAAAVLADAKDGVALDSLGLARRACEAAGLRELLERQDELEQALGALLDATVPFADAYSDDDAVLPSMDNWWQDRWATLFTYRDEAREVLDEAVSVDDGETKGS